MKRYLYYLLFGLFLFSGCSDSFRCAEDQKAFLINYFALVQEVGQSKMKADAVGWDNYDKQFKMMIEDCYQMHVEELSRGERHLFWAKSVQYYYYRYGANFLEVISDNEDSLTRRIRKETESRWSRADMALDDAMRASDKNWIQKRERLKQKNN